MANLEKTLASGAQLEITMAPFELGHKLLKIVTREAETIKLSFGSVEFDVDKLKDILGNDSALDTIKNICMRLISSEEINVCLWECMAYATYNKAKILRSNKVFESEEARGDFLVVQKEVLWFNLSPFFKNLSSELIDLLEKKSKNQSIETPRIP